jgi:hypothetical protein
VQRKDCLSRRYALSTSSPSTRFLVAEIVTADTEISPQGEYKSSNQVEVGSARQVWREVRMKRGNESTLQVLKNEQ